jgi:hypothetical protein
MVQLKIETDAKGKPNKKVYDLLHAYTTIELISGEQKAISRTGIRIESLMIDGKSRLESALGKNLLLCDDGSRIPLSAVRLIQPIQTKPHTITYRLTTKKYLKLFKSQQWEVVPVAENDA